MKHLDEPVHFTRPKKIKPHLPIWAQEGHTEVRRWIEDFEDRNGNKATICKVEYVDKKSKPHEVVAWVKWKNI